MKLASHFKPQILKISLLLSLLVILFLLISFVFITPENASLADHIQKVNAFLSWPYNMLESAARISLPWFMTAFYILIFWFVVFYILLLFFTFFKSGE